MLIEGELSEKNLQMFDKRFAMNKRQQITNPYQNAPLFMTENTKKKLDGD